MWHVWNSPKIGFHPYLRRSVLEEVCTHNNGIFEVPTSRSTTTSSWQWCDFTRDSVHRSESCPEFYFKNWCAPWRKRYKIQHGTQSGTEMLNFHDVFYHNVVQSYGHVVTRACHHDETCAPCNQSCQWRCQSCWNSWSNMELFLW